MSLPVKMEFRDFQRYLVSGLLAYLLYYPILLSIPYWNLAGTGGQLGISVVFIFVVGIVVDGIAASCSGVLTHPLHPVRRMKVIYAHLRGRAPKESEPTKFTIMIKATNEERELLRNEVSAGYMAGGCALVLISYLLVTLANTTLVILQGQPLFSFAWLLNPVLPIALSLLTLGFIPAAMKYQGKLRKYKKLKNHKRLQNSLEYAAEIIALALTIYFLITVTSLLSVNLQGQPAIPQVWPTNALLDIIVTLATLGFIHVGWIHYQNYVEYRKVLKEIVKKRPDCPQTEKRSREPHTIKRENPNRPKTITKLKIDKAGKHTENKKTTNKNAKAKPTEQNK